MLIMLITMPFGYFSDLRNLKDKSCGINLDGGSVMICDKILVTYFSIMRKIYHFINGYFCFGVSEAIVHLIISIRGGSKVK